MSPIWTLTWDRELETKKKKIKDTEQVNCQFFQAQADEMKSIYCADDWNWDFFPRIKELFIFKSVRQEFFFRSHTQIILTFSFYDAFFFPQKKTRKNYLHNWIWGCCKFNEDKSDELFLKHHKRMIASQLNAISINMTCEI